MKKIFLLFLLPILLGFSSIANAKCKLLSCEDKDWANARVTADVGGSQCWFCGPGPNSCGNNDVVPFVDGVGDIIGLSQCSTGLVQKFVNYEPGYFCDDSDLKSSLGVSGIKLDNAKKTYAFIGEKSTGYSLGDLEVFLGKASCIMMKCNEGYVPNENKTACVLDTRKSSCENSGGNWQDGNCSCLARKNLVLSGDKCVCKSDSYVFDNVNKQCNLKQEIVEEEENKKKCFDSGGNWDNGQCSCDSDKNMKLSGKECICISNEYKWDSGKKICVMTDSASCSKISGTYWDSNLQECLCSETNFVISGSKCILNPDIEKCNQVQGAEWLSSGICVCQDRSKVVDYIKMMCVDSQETIAIQQQNAAKERIASIVNNLDQKAANFKRSDWKNEDGKFNTSRLISDSVAGVVLGTAGGLITSSVVKKSQVKSGFEDLNCAIGGQVVAGWGDEFLVGIQ